MGPSPAPATRRSDGNMSTAARSAGSPSARLDVSVSRAGEISGATASSRVRESGLTASRQVEGSHRYAPGRLAACATITGTEIG